MWIEDVIGTYAKIKWYLYTYLLDILVTKFTNFEIIIDDEFQHSDNWKDYVKNGYQYLQFSITIEKFLKKFINNP